MPRNCSLGCPSSVGERGTIVTQMGRDTDGDGGRLEEMYVRFAPGGIRLAYLMTGDRAIAEDLVQEAFIRFVGRLHPLRDPGAFDAYLRRTVINLSKNYFRRRALERSDLERQASQPRPVHEERDVSEYETMRASAPRSAGPAASGDRPSLLRGSARIPDRRCAPLPTGNGALTGLPRSGSTPSEP